MAYINPFIKVNAGGIPRLQAESTSTSGNDLIYDFRLHRFLNYPYVGILVFKLPAVAAPSTAGNTYFTTAGENKVLIYDYAGNAITSTNSGLTSGGIFIGWYSDGKLLILNGIA